MPAAPLPLNELAWQCCERIVEQAARLKIAVSFTESGTRIIDCGAAVTGSLEAGRRMAEVCLAGLAAVEISAGRSEVWPGPAVTVRTDQPVLACMASQYAGWQVSGEKYFAMGSGPMRAQRGFSGARREPLFEHLPMMDKAERVVGVLETHKLPPDAVCNQIATDCGVRPEQVTLLVARTASLAGTVQVVARSIETALHKLHALGFDLARVESSFGTAPLPPVAAKDVVGIGRTNDAVLYGGEVTLWVRGDDTSLAEICPQIPSSASRDFGEPFGEIFERYGRDFYKIDSLLFSPACITLINLDSGRTHRHGVLRPDILARSFNA